jgi:hypothetical protein
MKTLLLAAALAAVALPARAQAVCGERAELVRRLAAEFAEVPVGRGLSADGRMVEVFASPEGSWTLVATRPDGQTCLAAAGEAWEAVAPEPAGRDS